MSNRIMYLRGSNGHPVGCIAIRLDNSNSKRTTAKYSVSALNPSDRFSRFLAKEIATGRLETTSRLITLGSYTDGISMHDITHAVMLDIASSNINVFPARAIKAAKLWLKKSDKFQMKLS